MRWSKLRSLVKEGFADSIARRVDIQSARYGACRCGDAWITLDGEVIANFSTRAHYNAQFLDTARRPRGQFADYGELSRQDAYRACWDFVHSLTLEAALADPDPLIQTLAVLDRRLGRRRLAQLDPSGFHPLAAVLLSVRRNAETPARPKVADLPMADPSPA